MQVTLNEIYRLCQKAAEGAGAPAGLDIEAAQATAWLLAHGFPVLDGLTDTLEKLTDQACRFDNAALSSTTLDAGAKAGPLIAPGLVDLLVARADVPLTVADLSLPLYLLPNALRYASDGKHFHFELASASGEQFILNVSPSGVLILGSTASTALTEPGGFQLKASDTPTGNRVAAGKTRLAVLANRDTFAKAKARSLTNGVLVDPNLWQRLQTLARKVLVPASAASRRGAGAVSSDNE